MQQRAPPVGVNLAWGELPALFPGFPQAGRWLPLLQRHAGLLGEAAARVRVTSVSPEEAVRRQYAESLELLRVIEEETDGPAALADIGSGGGFPGLVMAIVRPDLECNLIEPLGKRARLLAELAAELALPNVTVYAVRAEEAGHGPLRDALPVVTARAVAGLRELIEYTAPFALPGGLIALPKGSGLRLELDSAAASLAALKCEFESSTAMRPAVSATLSVALFRKIAATPAAYPRRAGVASRRPL